MPRLGLGLGAQNIRKVGGGAAPSGIAVATTNAVNISGNNSIVPDGTYTKVTTIGTRVVGSITSDQAYLLLGLVYLKEAGYNSVDYPNQAYGHILIPPNTTFTGSIGYDTSPMTQNFWQAGIVLGEDNEGYLYFGFRTFSQNLSTDANYIPTSGWSIPITITAA
jgi:hypothetical protein